MRKIKIYILLIFSFLVLKVESQELRKVDYSFLFQTWIRNTQLNPNSTLDGLPINQVNDIGIRRLRFSAWSQVTDRVFFYAQFGQNNFQYTSKLNVGSFFHDAAGECAIHKRMLNVGAGLTGWSGLSRYASPSVGSILSLDAPLYQQTTNSITDQFLRKLSIYGKGKIGKLDYRVILSKPMLVSNSLFPVEDINHERATFSRKPQNFQVQSYLNYQFLEEEKNTFAYTTGSYLGTKKVFNIGAGFIHQKDAMYMLDNQNDTTSSDMFLSNIDVFLDLPLSERKNAISCYLALSNYDFGKNYVRFLGVMNPVNGGTNTGISNNGNALPLIGTGVHFYSQLAYKLKDNFIKRNTIQVYSALQYANFQQFKNDMLMFEAGLNFLIDNSHKSKLSLGIQSRPTVDNVNFEIAKTNRKIMTILQYQIAF